MNIQTYSFENYNKLEDVIYYLGANMVMKMNVNLYHMSEKNGRSSFYQEVKYYNKRIGDDVINLKRGFDYYVTIENIKPIENIKEQVIIRQSDIYILRKIVNTVYVTFDKEFDNIYVKKANRLMIRKRITPVLLEGLPMNKYIVFTNDISEYNGETYPCIRISLSSKSNYTLMSQSKLAGLLECINNMDMFLYAQNMLNYFGKPDFGTNLYDMTAITSAANGGVEVKGPRKRTIQHK